MQDLQNERIDVENREELREAIEYYIAQVLNRGYVVQNN